MVRSVALVYALYLMLPIALLLIGSVGRTWTNTFLPTGTTLQWFAELWGDGSFRKAFSTSLIVALATCAINAVLVLPLAHALHHAASRGGAWAGRIVSSMPVAAPSVTLGFGYLIVFNTDAMPWLGSLPLLIAAHVVYTLPYLTNTLLADLRHLRLDRLEAAAATLGATEWQQFTGVVVPNLQHSLASGLIMVAALSIGEFNLSNLLVSFRNRTYPVLLLQAFYSATGLACAATMVLLILASLAAWLSSRSFQRSSP